MGIWQQSLLVEQVLSPRLVRPAKVADDLTIDVEVISLRALEQPEAGILRRSVALAIIAIAAACDEIVPGRVAAPRPGNDMIKSQVLRRKYPGAILAGVVIAKQDILTR